MDCPSIVRGIIACVALSSAGAGAVGCGSETQQIKFPVKEATGDVEVSKFYGWSAFSSDAANRSFAQLQQGHVEEAFATMQAEVAANPGKAYDHYDLAIIYEIKRDWAKALSEIELAQHSENSQNNSTFKDEHAFIVRHVSAK